MKGQRYNGSQFALVKEIRDVNAQKQQVEEKLRAAEELSNLILENAARREIVGYIIDKKAQGSPHHQDFAAQLGLESKPVSARVFLKTRNLTRRADL